MASSSNRRRYDEHGYVRSESEEMIAGAGTTPGSTKPPSEALHGKIYVRSDADMEMGRIGPQEPYIGTAVTDGGAKGDVFYGKEGRIVKTVSMNQTHSDVPDKTFYP